VNVEHFPFPGFDKFGTQDAHKACKYHQINIPIQQLLMHDIIKGFTVRILLVFNNGSLNARFCSTF
jgi:hypothetical protein